MYPRPRAPFQVKRLFESLASEPVRALVWWEREDKSAKQLPAIRVPALSEVFHVLEKCLIPTTCSGTSPSSTRHGRALASGGRSSTEGRQKRWQSVMTPICTQEPGYYIPGQLSLSLLHLSAHGAGEIFTRLFLLDALFFFFFFFSGLAAASE